MMVSFVAKALGSSIVLLWLSPVIAFAQAAEACGTSDKLLFHCTFDDGGKQVGLCLSTSGRVSYEFGSDFVKPELRLIEDVSQIEYKSRSSPGGAASQSVTLLNVDTRYEIVSERAPDGLVTGKINVRLPSGRQSTYPCDTGSVWPSNPLEGIGSLNSVTRPM